ncbi:MAG: DUF4249 family protein [Chitinophagales bacterium]
MNPKIFILFLLLFTSCLDEITFNTNDSNDGNLVIQAKLTKGNPSIISVKITQIGTLQGENTVNPIGVNVQNVRLTNDLGQNLDLTQQTNVGSYFEEIPNNAAQFSVETGQLYQLRILKQNGEEIVSVFEQMLATPSINSIGLEIKEGVVLDRFEDEQTFEYLEYHINTNLTTPSSTKRPFLKWNFEGAYQIWDLQPPEVPPPLPPRDLCYVTEKLNEEKVVVFDSNLVSDEELQQFAVLEEFLNSRYVYGYYLTVFQESLSEGAYNYWSQVAQVTERNGGLFETPAGEIESNFRNLNQPNEVIYGYFYAVEQDTLRRYVSPFEVGNPLHLCSEFSQDYDNAPSQCKDCLLWEGSSFTKPDYWE